MIEVRGKHWTVSYTPFTWYNRLLIRLNEQLVWQPYEQPLFVQPGWTKSHSSFNRLSNRAVAVPFVKPVYTIQPVVKFDNRLYRVYKHLTGCQTGLTRGNRFDNRLYRVNGALQFECDSRNSHSQWRKLLIRKQMVRLITSPTWYTVQTQSNTTQDY